MLKLLLPILFPSWRFFSSIGPSPRIDLGFIADTNTEPQEWIPYGVLPQKISFVSQLARLFHNPEWNLQLYLNTCAEHLIEEVSLFHEQDIGRHILMTIDKHKIKIPDNNTHLRFRIRTLEYENNNNIVQEKLVFISNPIALTAKGRMQ
jgi:hypothetical protein